VAELSAVSISLAPKRFLPFSSTDDNKLPLEKPLGESNAKAKVSGYFNEDVADSFFNDRLEVGGVFTVRAPAPIMKWHPAKQGTAARFCGHLSEIYPELDRIDDKDLDMLIRHMRSREE
jgi:hypothetical protein